MAIHPYNRYSSNVSAPSSDYPLGSARNVAVPGDGTGTPWAEDIVNDIWGWQQELLDKAGITVVGVGNPDTVGASDYFDAMRKTAGYPGMVTAHCLQVDPATLGIRMLNMDGSGILIANYPDLVAATYVGDSNNSTIGSLSDGAFYKATTAAGTTPNIAGPYFILPDVRGKFLRSYDPSEIEDPEGSGRHLGDKQVYKVVEHAHALQNGLSTAGIDRDISLVSLGYTTGSTYAYVLLWDGGSGTCGTGAMQDTSNNRVPSENRSTVLEETRPVNMAVKFGIWY